MNSQESMSRRAPVETQNVRRVKNAVRETVTNNRILAIVADVGSGKTTLVNYLADFWQGYPSRFRVVTLKGFEMRMSRISSIMRLLIETVNPDAYVPQQIERMYHALSVELRHFCKKRDNRVILMIDEAQDLNYQTFRDIKKVYEIDGHGRDHLLSVVLFGKPHRKWDKILASEELGFRIHPEFLEKLNNEELLQIAEERFGIKFSSKRVRERFASAIRFKTPLGVEFFSRSVRREMGISDDTDALITDELIQKIPMLTIKHRLRQAGITQTEYAKFANNAIPHKSITRQRVSEYFNGQIADDKLAADLELAAEQLITSRENDARKRLSGE